MNRESSADEPPPPSLLRQTATFVRSFWTDAGKQAAGNLAGLITCQALCLSCQLINLVVLPKALGKDVVGQYVFATLFFPYFYCIGSLAGGAIPLRDIRRDPARFSEIASSFLTLAASVSTFLAVLTCALISFTPISVDERFLFAIVACGAIFPCMGLSSLFDAHHRQGIGASASAAVEILNTTALVVCVSLAMLNLRTAAWLLLARWMLTTFLQWGIFFYCVRPIAYCPSAATMRRLLVASLAPIMMALIWNANILLSNVLVRIRFGASEIAPYGYAITIANVVITTNDLVLRILGPHIFGEHGLRPDFVRKLAAFLSAFTVATAAGAFVGAVLLVHVFLPELRDLLTPLAWMLAAVVARACWAVNDWYLLRFNKQHISLIAMFGTAVGSSLFGWLTPADLGPSGFPIGMFGFFTLAAVFTFLAARHFFKALSLRER